MKVFDDFGGDDVGIGGGVGGVFQAFLAEPEDVEAGFVAGDDLFVGVGAPAAIGSLFGPCWLAVVAACLCLVRGRQVVSVVAGDEFVEVSAGCLSLSAATGSSGGSWGSSPRNDGNCDAKRTASGILNTRFAMVEACELSGWMSVDLQDLEDVAFRDVPRTS